MKIRLCILLSLFTSLVSAEVNFVTDPGFKQKKHWSVVKKAENKDVKDSIKKGMYSFKTLSESSLNYYSLSHELNLEEGHIYKFSMEVKATGEGKIRLNYGEGLGVIKKMKRVNKERLKGLGLQVYISGFSGEWQTYEAYFFVPKIKSKYKGTLSFLYGSFKGDFVMKNLKVIRVQSASKELGEVGRNGVGDFLKNL